MFLIYLLTARSVSDSVYDNVHVNVCKPVDTLRILFTLHTFTIENFNVKSVW